MRRIVVRPDDPDSAALDEAARAIRGGGVVAIPTDTLYGLAADPFRLDAVERVFEVKGRGADRALPLIASDPSQVSDRIGTLPALGLQLAVAFWPGPLTLLVSAPADLPPEVTAGSGKVAVRVPANTIARRLCTAAGMPLTATSANLSGMPASADPDEVARTLGDRLEMLIDGGVTAGGAPSTIVDVTGQTPVLVRTGAIRWEDIQACLREHESR